MTLLELMGSLDPLDATLLSSYDTTGPVLSVPVLIDPYEGRGGGGGRLVSVSLNQEKTVT